MEDGEAALIVYDDLSKQADAIARSRCCSGGHQGARPTGRRLSTCTRGLLERAAKLSTSSVGVRSPHCRSIETRRGDISAYIPTT